MLFTMLQSQKRCRMVSLVSPQKAHNSVSTSLHLYKNVFVGMVLWRSLYILKHFQCIIKSTVIWQNVNKFPIYFFNIQQIFPFILRIYRSFSIFFQEHVIKSLSNCSMLDQVTDKSLIGKIYWWRKPLTSCKSLTNFIT